MLMLQISQDFKWNQNSWVGKKRRVKCISFSCLQLWISNHWYLGGREKRSSRFQGVCTWPIWDTNGAWWRVQRDSPVQESPGSAERAGTHPAAELRRVSHRAGLRLRWTCSNLVLWFFVGCSFFFVGLAGFFKLLLFCLDTLFVCLFWGGGVGLCSFLLVHIQMPGFQFC